MPASTDFTITTAESATAIPRISSSVLASVTMHVSVVAIAIGASWVSSRRDVSMNVQSGNAAPPSQAAVQLVVSVSEVETVVAVTAITPMRTAPEIDKQQTAGGDLGSGMSLRKPLSIVPDGDQPAERPLTDDLRDRPGFARTTPAIWASANIAPKPVPTESPRNDVVSERAEMQETPDPVVETKKLKRRPKRRAKQRPIETSLVAIPKSANSAVASERLGAQFAEMAAPRQTNIPPQFPSRALAERRSGRLVLHVTVSDLGTVASINVHDSSGHADLDQAAVTAVERWRFDPAKKRSSSGKLITAEQTIAVPITFAFDD